MASVELIVIAGAALRVTKHLGFSRRPDYYTVVVDTELGPRTAAAPRQDGGLGCWGFVPVDDDVPTFLDVKSASTEDPLYLAAYEQALEFECSRS